MVTGACDCGIDACGDARQWEVGGLYRLKKAMSLSPAEAGCRRGTALCPQAHAWGYHLCARYAGSIPAKHLSDAPKT